MTTINTMHDLHRILVEHPEWRSELRQVLLTDELLALPQRFAEYAENTDRKFDALTADVSALTANVNALTLRVDALTTSISEYKDATNLRLDRIEERLDIQHGMYRRQHDDLHRFRGNYASFAANKDDVIIAGAFGDVRGMRSIDARSLSRSELSDLLRYNPDAVSELGLRERVERTFLRPDLIAEVTELYGDDDREPEFYIAVEASYTANEEDLLRATDHAKILRHVTGLDAYPVIASVRLDRAIEDRVFHDVAEFVVADDADAVVWYELATEDMEPLDPC